MNLAMVKLYCGESGQLGYYNMQELGLAKSLTRYGLNIYIMILDDTIRDIKEEKVLPNITMVYIPAKKIGSHGIFNCDILMKYKINIVHLQSDNQLYAPHVMRFCKRNKIKCYNYVGTLFSDSSNYIKRVIMNLISRRNIRYYRKFFTFSKTPTIKNQLEKEDVPSKVAHVGLDMDIIPEIKESKEQIRIKLRFPVEKKILIFVGRLEDYKAPFDSIELIKKLSDDYILIIIGKGSLKDALIKKIKEYNIEYKVHYFESVPNTKIHEYYKLSDFFINFNEKEIFGMSILEAMYQGCIVIAKEAPGPSFIIENKSSGFIVKNIEDIVKIVYSMNEASSVIGMNGHNRIISTFNWTVSAEIIYTSIVY